MADLSIDFGEWGDLPLFPDLVPNETVFRSEDADSFDDPFLNELVRSRPIQRLKKIGFLGAIDYVVTGNGRETHRRRHNRYDHSIGVAQLAGHYAKIRELSLNETRLLMAAGLLHDVGHGPLSHTLEPVFKREFGVSHHQTGSQIIHGESPYGPEISNILAKYQVDLEEMNAYIECEHDGPHGYLFSSPINLDTIEGITRSRSFFARSSALIPALTIVSEIAKSDSLPTQSLDAFWELKHEVYNVFIHHDLGLIFDGLAQAYMVSEIEKFNPTDFLWTEDQLRQKWPELFYIFSWAQKSRLRLLYRVHDELLDHEVSAPKRSFFVDDTIELGSIDDLRLRYQQKKTMRSMVIRDLVETKGTAA